MIFEEFVLTITLEAIPSFTPFIGKIYHTIHRSTETRTR